MFYQCSALKVLDLSNFDTYKVTNMKGTFCGCKSLKVLTKSNFNTINVTNMNSRFDNVLP